MYLAFFLLSKTKQKDESVFFPVHFMLDDDVIKLFHVLTDWLNDMCFSVLCWKSRKKNMHYFKS